MSHLQTQFQGGSVYSVPSVRAAEDCAAYFQQLAKIIKRGQFLQNEFEQNWAMIPGADFSADVLTHILVSVAKNSNHLNSRKHNTLERYLHSHIIAWHDASFDRIDTFSPNDLGSVLNAYGILSFRPQQVFLNSFENILRARSQDLDANGITDTLRGYARLGIMPAADIMDDLMTRLETMTGSMSINLAVSNLWALAILDCLDKTDNSKLHDVSNALFDRLPPYIMSPVYQRQVAHAALWFDKKPPVLGPENGTGSRLEEKTRHIFAQAGIKVAGKTITVPHMQHDIDFIIFDKARDIWVEIDGPSHYVYGFEENTGKSKRLHFNGSTAFQTALMMKMAVSALILRMPFSVIDRLLNAGLDIQKQTTRSILDSLHEKSKGAWHVDIIEQSDGPGVLQLLEIHPAG